MAEMAFNLPRSLNFERLVEELRSGVACEGVRTDSEHIYVVFDEAANVEALRPAIEAVIAAHDPAALTAEQQAEAVREAAAETLRAADFLAVRTAIQNASTLAALRPILLAMLRLIWLVAKAQRLSDAAEPEV